MSSQLQKAEMISFDKNSKDLGKGGFGLVRLGQFDGQAVAVKSLFVDSDTVDPLAAAELFLSEAKKMRELEHPRIVKFLGFIMGKLAADFYPGLTFNLLISTLPKESFSIVMEFMAEG